MMSDSSVVTIWSIFTTLIISGGIVAGLFEWLRSYIAKRREEYLDISKLKIEYISKSIPYYGQMIFYHKMISRLLRTKQYAKHRNVILYYLCNLLNVKNSYFKEFGTIQLGSFRAEALLVSVSEHLDSMIADKIGITNMSIISNLVDDKITYQHFEDKLSLNEVIVQDFFERFFF